MMHFQGLFVFMDKIAENQIAEPVADVVETVADTPIEQPSEPLEVNNETASEADKPEDVTEGADAPAEEAPAEEVTETAEVAPIVFEPTDDDAVFAEKASQVLAKFDLEEAPEIKAYIEALEARAKAVETPEIFSQINEYGDVEAVKSILSEHNHIYSRREENGQFRPNTDKFAEAITAKDRDTADFLYFDLATQPSRKYQGINRFEEGIVDALSVDGDTVGSALSRYQALITGMRDSAAAPMTDIPAFIPAELYAAYRQLPKETREDIELWADDESFSVERANKLHELRTMQKGIDAEIAAQQAEVQKRQAFQTKLVQDAEATQTTFLSEMRKTMAEKLTDVQFSPDAKLNKLLAGQQVTLLEQAFLPEGEFARQILAEAGIEFDQTVANSLVTSLAEKSAALAAAKNAVDSSGKPLDPVAVSTAEKQLAVVTKNWLEFANNIVRQQKQIATSTAKAVDAAVEKKKIAPKARPVTTGNGASPKQGPKEPPSHIRVGSYEWDQWYAQQTIAEQEMKKSAAYR